MSSILACGVSTGHPLPPPLAVTHLPQSCTGLWTFIVFWLLDLAVGDLPWHAWTVFYWV